MTKIAIASAITAVDSAVKTATAELVAAEAARDAAHAAGGVDSLWALFVEGREANTSADLELAEANKAADVAKRKVAVAKAAIGRRVYGRGY